MIPNTGFLLVLNPPQKFPSIVGIQPHRSNQKIESSSVSLCKFEIHLNNFQRSLDQSKKYIWEHPTVIIENCQQKKYQVNNQEEIFNLVAGLDGTFLDTELRYQGDKEQFPIQDQPRQLLIYADVLPGFHRRLINQIV